MTTKNFRKIPCAELRVINKELTGQDGHAAGIVELANIAARYKGWPELEIDTPHKQDYAIHYLYLYQLERDKTSVWEGNGCKEHFVYFIQAGIGGPIKIGFTSNVEKRLSALQTGCAKPLNVIAKISFTSKEAAAKYERELHELLSAYRQKGEWFGKRILSRLAESRHEVEVKQAVTEGKTIFDYVINKKNFPRRFKLEAKHLNKEN